MVMGSNTFIGVEYSTSSVLGAINQRNVFSRVHDGAMIEISGGVGNVISGNWFGYLPNGNIQWPSASLDTAAIYLILSPGTTFIGSNMDSTGDSLEFNWFGGLYANNIQGEGTYIMIRGNYFGYLIAGDSLSGARSRADIPEMIRLGNSGTGTCIIGNLQSELMSRNND